MKLEKISSEILNLRKTTSNEFTITNNKGKTMDIDIISFYQDDEVAGWDNDETIYNDNEQEITWNDIQDFLGEADDVEELRDDINDLMEK